MQILSVGLQNQATSGRSSPEIIRHNTQPSKLFPPGRAILILGADRLFRGTLKLLLESDGFLVISAQDTVEFSQSYSTTEAPDVFVYSLDSQAEIEEDLSAIRTIRQRFPDARTLVLAGTANTMAFTRLARAGVEGLMLKDISSEVLGRAIQFLLLGQRVLPAGIARGLFDATEQSAVIAPGAEKIRGGGEIDGQRRVAISERERQIIQCLVEGLSNKAIARRLDIAEATVKVHVKALLRKLQLSNRTQAAVWGLNHSEVPWTDE